MGYASGMNYRDDVIGYGHQCTCAHEGCEADIDKGLYFTCGGMEGVDGERGCGRHFCGSHLFYNLRDEPDDYDPEYDPNENAAICAHCLAREQQGLPTGMEDISWW